MCFRDYCEVSTEEELLAAVQALHEGHGTDDIIIKNDIEVHTPIVIDTKSEYGTSITITVPEHDITDDRCGSRSMIMDEMHCRTITVKAAEGFTGTALFRIGEYDSVSFKGNCTAALVIDGGDKTTCIINYGMTQLDDNTVVTHGRAPCGGGIINYNHLCISGCRIIHNNAEIGGGIDNRCFCNMTSGEISHNTATDSGAGIRNRRFFRMYDGLITHNTSLDMSGGGGGGGVHNDGGSKGMADDESCKYVLGWYDEAHFEMYGGEITYNTSWWGGGVGSSGIFTLYDGKICYNTARSRGGGVHNNDTFKMHGGTISHNVSIEKGTYWHGGGVANMRDFIMYSGLIEYNTSDEGGGVDNEGVFCMHGGRISSNIAHSSGGGIHNHCMFRLYKGSVSQNTAHDSGGGVYNTDDMLMYGGAIYHNSAKYGGGIYNHLLHDSSEHPLIIYGGEVQYNAALTGGGICHDTGDELPKKALLVIGAPPSSRRKPKVILNQGGLPPAEDEDIVYYENVGIPPDIIEGRCEVGVIRSISQPEEPQIIRTASQKTDSAAIDLPPAHT